VFGYDVGNEMPGKIGGFEMATPQLDNQNSAAAIFSRVWEGETGSLSVPISKHVLKLGFGVADTQRMQELIERNREGKLTDAELEELDNFIKIGDLLAILQSKARKSLKRAASPRAAHG